MSGRSVSRREALRITAVTGLATALGGSLGMALWRDARLHRVSGTRTRLGTLVNLTVVHPDPGLARRMVDVGFAEMARLEGILSRYRPESAVGRLNATGIVEEAPRELLVVVEAAKRMADASDGAFDPTVLPLLDTYRRAFEDEGRPPGPDALRAAAALVDHRRLRLDGSTVTLDGVGMGMTLDGIAKGFVVDETVGALMAEGAERVLVDAGGDMATGEEGPTAGEEATGGEGPAGSDGGEGALGGSSTRPGPWRVGVENPHRRAELVETLRLDRGGVATSGDYVHAFTRDRRFHHVIDPRTGRSPPELSSVTVTAASAMMADALSTTVMVLGPEKGLRFLDAYRGSEGLVVTKSGDRLRTEGFGGRLS